MSEQQATSETRATTATLIALRCPTCKAALACEPRRVLCLCPACPTAVEVTRDGLVGYEATFEKGSGPYQLWWRLDAAIAIDKFAATKPATTPFGTADASRTLTGAFLIPANADSIGACYRAALEQKKPPASAPRDATSVATAARLSRQGAEQVARQVFLTHVARAEGKVHYLDFVITVTKASVIARP